MGLPSGTLWLDRLVGAPSPNQPGLFFQWGALEGHTVSDGYAFDSESYNASGLNLINHDLSDNEDAARAFYGPTAKMPSEEQVQELIQYTSVSLEQPSFIRFTSLINGKSFVLYRGGYIENGENKRVGELRVWLTHYVDANFASSLHGSDISTNARHQGLNIIAVHS